MCGILGLIPAVPLTDLKRALDTIAHRGPDGEGLWNDEDNSISLAHRRLAILDLSYSGKQPMHFGNLTIVYNGEIYNFLEIKSELESKGFVFVTTSDTEVILAAYQHWGVGCLQKFNGMWAFAIWDKNERQLFLSRDRFGVKPLYYSFIGGKFVFASEMKAIFPFLSQVQPSKNFNSLKEQLFNYEQSDECIIQGIKRLPAGNYCYVKLDDRALTPISYWNTADHLQTVPDTYEKQVDRFRELFLDACKIRMRADVPIGTALSGGLDSSSIISSMALVAKDETAKRLSKSWQHAFIASFPGTFLDEVYYADKVIDHLKIPVTRIIIDPAVALDTLEKDLYMFEDLYITSPAPMMQTYKAMRDNGVVVSIDGHGADEMLSGYGHIPHALKGFGLNVPKIKNVLNTLQGIQSVGTSQINAVDYNLKWYESYMRKEFKGRKNVLNYYLQSSLGKVDRKTGNGQDGSFNEILYELFHKTVLPTLLRNYDKYSMAHGVEIRMPFMDYRLVSYAFSLPAESKMKNGFSKSILRDAMKGVVTEDVRTRKTKIGFNTPVVDWMQGKWKTYLLDTIYSTEFLNSNVIDSKEVQAKILKVVNNSNSLFSEGEEAWSSLMPFLWERSVIKNYRNYVA